MTTVRQHAPALVIVCGSGRSGTSLLHAMVSAHPDVVGMPETGLLRRALTKSRNGRWGPDELKRWLKRDPRIDRMGLSESEISSALETFQAEGAGPPIALYLRLVSIIASRAGLRTVVDKDPRLVEMGSTLAKVVEIKAILLTARDPRDVFVSRLDAEWSAAKSPARNTFATAAQAAATLALHKRGPKVTLVRYEDLVREPNHQLTRVCQAMDLQYSGSMVRDFSNAAASLTSPEELQWKRRTLGALETERSGVWKRSNQSHRVWLRVIELVCASYFASFDYERALTPSGVRMDWIGRVAWRFTKIVEAARGKLRRAP